MEAQQLLNDLQDLGIDIRLIVNKIPERTLVSVHDNNKNYLIKDFRPEDGEWNLREVSMRLSSLSPLSITYRAEKSGQSYIQEVEVVKPGDNIVGVAQPIKDFIVNSNLMHSMIRENLIEGETTFKVTIDKNREVVLEPVKGLHRIENKITISKTEDTFEVD